MYRMEADHEAARLLTIKAAWMADNRMPNSLDASICKAKSSSHHQSNYIKMCRAGKFVGYSYKELIEKWAEIQKYLIYLKVLNKSNSL